MHWHNSKLYAHGWEAWCAQSGENWLAGQPIVREYDEEHYALQAAIAGQGLVLASNILVSESVASGLLLAYRGDVQVDGAGYSALCVPGRERHPPVGRFLRGCGEEALAVRAALAYLWQALAKPATNLQHKTFRRRSSLTPFR